MERRGLSIHATPPGFGVPARTPHRARTTWAVCRWDIAVRAILIVALLVVAAPPRPAAATAVWSRNLWVSSAFLYQDPYFAGCTAASTMFMLNLIAYRQTGGAGFSWTPTRVKQSPDSANTRDLTSILDFARRYDTLRATGLGSDPHGWRNTLNAYGWNRGSVITDPGRMVYEDRSYRTFRGAVTAAVKAIARGGMPVGVVAWAGGHAQVMTGYEVSGADPRTSDDFTVRYVYLSDPLRRSGLVNRKVSIAALAGGAPKLRFQAYWQSDSPFDDPYRPGTLRSSVRLAVGPSEWYRRWVLLVPVRNGVPPVESPADATPAPAASASPVPTDSAEPTETPTPVDHPVPTDTPAPTRDSGAPDSPAPTDTPSPDDPVAATVSP